MGSRGIVGRALRTRCMRAAALAGICALAVQSARLPMMLQAEAAACCCPHRAAEEVCNCPVCAHQRLLESDRPAIETCAAAGHADAIAATDAAVLAARTGRASRFTTPRSTPLVVLPPPDPVVDVPTPPPLARG
jgi:hypothetical protein